MNAALHVCRGQSVPGERGIADLYEPPTLHSHCRFFPATLSTSSSICETATSSLLPFVRYTSSDSRVSAPLRPVSSSLNERQMGGGHPKALLSLPSIHQNMRHDSHEVARAKGEAVRMYAASGSIRFWLVRGPDVSPERARASKLSAFCFIFLRLIPSVFTKACSDPRAD